MTDSQNNFRCPHCRLTAPTDSANLPFCSEQCRSKDLNAWAAERYIIEGPDCSITEGSESFETSEDPA